MNSFLSIFICEIRDQFASKITISAFAALFAIGFLLTANGSEFQTFAPGGNIKVNAPYVLTRTLIIMSVFSVFTVPAFIASSILKDTENRFDPILFSTPIGKYGYLSGRFLGGFCALAVVFSGAALGMLSGTFIPWADPELFGPFQLSHYLFVFGLILLPVLLTISTLIFAAAIYSRSMLVSYIVALALLFFYLISSGSNVLTPLLDPFMYKGFELQTEFWTAAERNTQLISIDKNFILNRTIWLGLSALVLILTYWQFSFQVLDAKTRKKQESTDVADTPPFGAIKPFTFDTPIWTKRTPFTQFTTHLLLELRSIILSFPFVVVAGLALFMTFISLANLEIAYGVPAHPHTRLLIGKMGSLAVPFLAIITFFSAEIMTRERRTHYNEILDASPVQNSLFVLSKITALSAVLLLILLTGILLSISLQLISGHDDLQVSLWLERGFIYFIIPYICLTILACFFQILSQNRFVGMLLFGAFLAAVIGAADLFKINHPLFSFGIPAVEAPLSDINKPSQFAAIGYWVRAYWLGIAGVILIATYKIWPRGLISPFSRRFATLISSREGRLRMLNLAALLVTVMSGSIIYYNTNVQNDYRSQTAIENIRYQYELDYRSYLNRPSPKTASIDVKVDLYPEDRRVEVSSTHTLVNRTQTPIHDFIVIFPQGLTLNNLKVDDGTSRVMDADLNLYEIKLERPFSPGEDLDLIYDGQIERRGFPHAQPDTSLVANGTFIIGAQLTPYIGFDPDIMLQDKTRRRARGLPPLPHRPSLNTQKQLSNNSARQDSDFISFEAVVSTSEGQIAIMPGDLLRQWGTSGRSHFHYKSETPVRHFFAVLSGEYEVFKDRWRGVDIEILYHQPHDYNLERIMDGAKDSLAYYSDVFGPYQFSHLRIVEFPAYRDFAQSFPGLIPYSEDIGFLAKVGNSDLDFPYFVTAHEVSHQWWGHQLTAANVEGDGFLHETLAQYSALLVFERKYGVSETQRLLAYERDKYLSGRAKDPLGETPLYRVKQQDYIYYRKGALAMYALRDQLGEDVINASLEKLLSRFAYQSTPYPTSQDFLDILKQEAGPNNAALISDLLEYITLYVFQMNAGTVAAEPDGTLKSTVSIQATKFRADAKGNETEIPLDQDAKIAFYKSRPKDTNDELNNLVHTQIIRLKSGTNTFVINLPEDASFAMVDPKHIYIDRTPSDNLIELSLSPSP